MKCSQFLAVEYSMAFCNLSGGSEYCLGALFCCGAGGAGCANNTAAVQNINNSLWGRLVTCRRLQIGLFVEASQPASRFSIGGRLPICPTIMYSFAACAAH